MKKLRDRLPFPTTTSEQTEEASAETGFHRGRVVLFGLVSKELRNDLWNQTLTGDKGIIPPLGNLSRGGCSQLLLQTPYGGWNAEGKQL